VSSIAPPDRLASAGRWSQVTTWGARLAWLAVAVIGGRAIGDAAAGRSDPVQVVAAVGAWAGWALGAVALAVLAVATLTAARVIVPGALAVTVACIVFGADTGVVLALAVPAVLATVLVGAAETGAAFVQASAYGDERRLLLRPPLGYLAASVGSWLIWVTTMVAAPLSWAAAAWVPAAVATIVAAAGCWLLPRRWHQLSRRWLVAVPAGLVVHDPVVLGDTLMLPRPQVRSIGLAGPAAGETDGTDLTGPTPGVAVEIRLAAPATAVMAPRPGDTRRRTVPVRAVFVSPSRPGVALAEVRRRGYAATPPPST
jgi:hypothetical protein